MDDQPKNVKDLLVELKDASELMVDLAYAAVFFNDEKLAREVGRLEQRMSEHLRRLRIMAMLAARSPEDAEGMAGVLWIADAIEKIGDAASDIARVVAARLGIPDALRPDLRHADEMTGPGEGPSGRPGGRTDPARPLAPHRDRHVGHGHPQRSRLGVRPGSRRRRVSAGDVLLIRGPEEGVNEVRELAGAPPMPLAPDDDTPALSELDRAVDILVEMKDLAEAAVGLAYSSLLFNNRALAAEVGTLEARSDQPPRRARILGPARGAGGPRPRRAPRPPAPRQPRASTICDAARDMTWYVEHGEPLHPVVQMALEETEETSAETVVEPGSPADGRP